CSMTPGSARGSFRFPRLRRSPFSGCSAPWDSHRCIPGSTRISIETSWSPWIASRKGWALRRRTRTWTHSSPISGGTETTVGSSQRSRESHIAFPGSREHFASRDGSSSGIRKSVVGTAFGVGLVAALWAARPVTASGGLDLDAATQAVDPKHFHTGPVEIRTNGDSEPQRFELVDARLGTRRAAPRRSEPRFATGGQRFATLGHRHIPRRMCTPTPPSQYRLHEQAPPPSLFLAQSVPTRRRKVRSAPSLQPWSLRSGNLAGRKGGTMKKGIRIAIAALAVAGVGAMAALAQNADKNTAGPTKNDYKMKVVEPVVGGVISGPTVRVVVDTLPKPEVGGEKTDVNSMPRPDVRVFLDNDQKGELKAEQNVLTIENVPAGEHKLVLVATNRSGEIIDRQEIPFVSEAVTVATTTTTSETTSSSAYTPPAPRPPPPPAPAPAPASRAPAPAPAPPPPAYESSTLPRTATSDPLLVVGGLALIGAGLLARRAAV